MALVGGRKEFVRIDVTAPRRVSDGNIITVSLRKAVVHHARHLVSTHHPRVLRGLGTPGPGGGEALIIFELTALALGIAGVVYLVVALLKPERF